MKIKFNKNSKITIKYLCELFELYLVDYLSQFKNYGFIFESGYRKPIESEVRYGFLNLMKKVNYVPMEEIAKDFYFGEFKYDTQPFFNFLVFRDIINLNKKLCDICDEVEIELTDYSYEIDPIVDFISFCNGIKEQ